MVLREATNPLKNPPVTTHYQESSNPPGRMAHAFLAAAIAGAIGLAMYYAIDTGFFNEAVATYTANHPDPLTPLMSNYHARDVATAFF